MKVLWILTIIAFVHDGLAAPSALSWVMKRNNNKKNTVNLDTESMAKPEKRSECPTECVVQEKERIVCTDGFEITYRSKCEKRGCCFDPTGDTKCFNKKVTCDDDAEPTTEPLSSRPQGNVQEQLCGIDMSIRVSCGQENAMTCRIAGCCWDESTPNSNRTLKCYQGNRVIFMQDRYDTNYGTSSSTTEVIDTTVSTTTRAKVRYTQETSTTTKQQATTTTEPTTTTTEPTTTTTTTTTEPTKTTAQATIISSTNPASIPIESSSPKKYAIKLYCANENCSETENFSAYVCEFEKGCCPKKDPEGNYVGCRKFTRQGPMSPGEYKYSTIYYFPTSITNTNANPQTNSSPTITTATTKQTTTTTMGFSTIQPSTPQYLETIPWSATQSPIYQGVQPYRPITQHQRPQGNGGMSTLMCLISVKMCLMQQALGSIIQGQNSFSFPMGSTRRPAEPISHQPSNPAYSETIYTGNNQNGIPKTGENEVNTSQSVRTMPVRNQFRMVSPYAQNRRNMGATNPFGSMFNAGRRSQQVPPRVQRQLPTNAIQYDYTNNTRTVPSNSATASNPSPFGNNPAMMSLLCTMLSKDGDTKICEILSMLQPPKTADRTLPSSEEWLNFMVDKERQGPDSTLEILHLLQGKGESLEESRSFYDPVKNKQCSDAKKAKKLFHIECTGGFNKETCEAKGCCWTGDYYTSMMQSKGNSKSPLIMMMMQQMMGGAQNGPMCIKGLDEPTIERVLIMSMANEASLNETMGAISVQSIMPLFTAPNGNNNMFSLMTAMNQSPNSQYAGSSAYSPYLPLLGNTGSGSSGTSSILMDMLMKQQFGGTSSGSSNSMAQLLPYLLQSGQNTESSTSPSSQISKLLGGGSSFFGGNSGNSPFGGSSSLSSPGFDIASLLNHHSSSNSGVPSFLGGSVLGEDTLAAMFGERSANDNEHALDDI